MHHHVPRRARGHFGPIRQYALYVALGVALLIMFLGTCGGWVRRPYTIELNMTSEFLHEHVDHACRYVRFAHVLMLCAKLCACML